MSKPRRIIISELDAALFHQLATMASQAIHSQEILGDEFAVLMQHLNWKEILAVHRGTSEGLPDRLSEMEDQDWREVQMALVERAQLD